MTTRHLVDPELIPSLDRTPSTRFALDTLPQVRADREASRQANSVSPNSPDIALTEWHVPGPEGAPDVRVLVYRPKRASGVLPAILWIHGGGYVAGVAELDKALRRVAISVSCVLVSVDYRLAPETPFPGPLEDCYAALTWLHAHADELGVDGGRIAVGGASAGGGLAAGLGLAARDRGEVPLALQLLVYPMLDDRTVTAADPHPHTGEFVWTPESNRFGWTCYLGQEPGGAGVSPYAAAARAERLESLPPTFIAVGALDLFVEEDLEYARRLMRAGVPTELHVYPGAYHGFTRSAGARITREHYRDVARALQAALRTE